MPTSVNRETNDKHDILELKKKYETDFAKESIIIGNGPSLKLFLENHINFIERKTIFCINSFATSIYFELIKPTFYVFADPNYWNKNCSESLSKEHDAIYQIFKNCVTWKMIILLPTNAKKWNWFIDLPQTNNNIEIAYYGVEPAINHENRFLEYKENKAAPPFQTVLVAAIFLSLNLGFKTQYLVGADLSLHETVFVDDENVVCNTENHFYEEKVHKHSKPFWKNSENTVAFKMDELFLAFSIMFKGFRELEAYSKYLNSKIYNASNKSYIDSFERYDLKTKMPKFK